jgi:hypothetical protein
MRWEEPKVGQILWKKKFAFFPKKINKTRIWLEMYYVKCEFTQKMGNDWGYNPVQGTTVLVQVPWGSPHWVKTEYLSDDEIAIKENTPLSKALNENT